ncbi:hypothetical protein LTR22_000237 [Elasticomyces elasticus]|nr:hypothetical protein LTR22_000237 [Elasticomyces elasticus]KAK4930597.1 hypothetical protein LTR49_003011 [Elasticomyces elasticus]KAK5757916.1 hypothetical protein LTS12_011955 [Elasticomyces elasticus]
MSIALSKQPALATDVSSDQAMPDKEGSLAVHTDVVADVVVVTSKRPYREVNFIFTYIAACLGALASFGSFVMPATSLALINESIGRLSSPKIGTHSADRLLHEGPSPNIAWVALAFTLCLSVGYTLLGRLSDLFGRRWFWIASSMMATVGCIICSTASSVNQVIGGTVLIGLAGAAQLSFNYLLAELVPIKDRYYVLGSVFLATIPFSSFGAVISRLFIVHTASGWRWDYYLNIIINGLSTLLYFFFYHPPSFDELHQRRSKWEELRKIDFVGIVLFVAGLLLFLMGLSWGGSLYAWNSAHVISTLVVGFVTSVVFVLWECFAPLERPLVPMRLFRSRGYCVLTLISGIGGMLYYSLNVIYPTMVGALFTTDIVKAGLLTCVIGGGVAAGAFTSNLWAKSGGHFRWKLFFAVVACTAFSGALAGAKTETKASALACVASYFIGSVEGLVGSAITIVVDDQTELGVAVGVYGSIRSIFGVLATSIFATILTSRVSQDTRNHVVPALLEAGLPSASLAPLLSALSVGNIEAAETIPGVTQHILLVAASTMKAAYSDAFTLLFLVTLAFGGVSCITAYFTPALEHRYTEDVIRRLHGSDPAAAATTVDQEDAEPWHSGQVLSAERSMVGQ